MKVVITRKLPAETLNEIPEDFEVVMWEEENVPMPHDLLLKEVQDADGILTNVSDRIDGELYTTAAQLKVVSTMAVGYDNIDVEEASRRGIPVGHTPGVLTEATADLTFALLMATARRVVEGMDYVREGHWKSWGPMLLTGQNIYGATIGIIGMGRIGQAVAKRASGFEMNILYHNRNRKEEAEQNLGATYCSLDELLKKADYVVLLAPSTPETYHMIGARELSLMKPNAVFINTSRGTNVDEEALYHALQSRQIWAAGLDVFEKEPIAMDHPLLTLENVTLLPHIGSANIETRLKMADIAVHNLILGVQRKKLLHAINPQVYQ